MRFCIERSPANVALVQLVTIERDPLLGHHLKKHTARRIQLLIECLLPFFVTDRLRTANPQLAQACDLWTARLAADTGPPTLDELLRTAEH